MAAKERDMSLRKHFQRQLVREEEGEGAHERTAVTPVVLLRNLRHQRQYTVRGEGLDMLYTAVRAH